MNAEQERAFNRLLKKLGSLRVTLRKDERDILDAIVLTTPSEVIDGEVSFHAMADAKTEALADAASEVSFHAMADAQQEKLAEAASEVSFHAMADAKTEAQADAASEVSFNAMADASQDRYADRVAYRYNCKIVLDDESQTYRIVSRTAK